ncbi:MAG TPA: cytochrome c oxidase subunit II transmembrane domain-containing protein [Gemmataceae bacterium]|nr:cytochrome c oxidase subunit II transmembrane domain-containing protein [Gemmataceae bacterium]
MGNKFWSILFGVVMAACFIGFAISPFMGWWRPDGISSHAGDVDFLFDVILGITAFFFVLTEGILVYFMWHYASEEGKHPVSPAKDFPNVLKPLAGLLTSQHHVELAWTLIPAAILIYIAVAQVDTWANIKYESRKSHTESPTASLQVAVSARQFEWRMRYPTVARYKKWQNDKKSSDAKTVDEFKKDYESFGKVPQADDVHVVNELHIYQDHQIMVWLSTRDVIHSFNLPNFRVKQDALPGKLIPVWFKTKEGKECWNTTWDADKHRYVDGVDPKTGKVAMDASGNPSKEFMYDIACAELCGWGHYRMIGRVFVHQNEADFLNWLSKAEANNKLRTPDR